MKKSILSLLLFVFATSVFAQSYLTEEQQAALQAQIDTLNATIKAAQENYITFVEKNIVKSVCGVEFGSSKEMVKSILQNKYGSPQQSYREDIISYENIRYAGYNFNTIHFQFQSDGYKTYLSGVYFILNTKTKEQTLEMMDRLYDTLSEKYVLEESEDDGTGKAPYFKGGISPLWNENINMFTAMLEYRAFVCSIIEYEQELVDIYGYKYAVRLAYGPYEYVKEEF